MTHLAQFRKDHHGLSLKEAMKKASHSYKKHPHKGKASRTRKGRKDFVTHKGDKDFNKGNKRQRKSRKPYRKSRKHGKKGKSHK